MISSAANHVRIKLSSPIMYGLICRRAYEVRQGKQHSFDIKKLSIYYTLYGGEEWSIAEDHSSCQIHVSLQSCFPHLCSHLSWYHLILSIKFCWCIPHTTFVLVSLMCLCCRFNSLIDTHVMFVSQN